MTKIKTLAVTLSALTSLIVSNGALAHDNDDEHAWREYTGNMCKAAWGGTGDLLDRTADGTYNRGDFPVWVSCPIIRDQHESSDSGHSRVYINVRVTHDPREDFTSEKAIFCAVETRGWDTRWFNWYTHEMSHPFQSQLKMDMEQNHKWGQSALYCRMPPQSFIFSYFVARYHN